MGDTINDSGAETATPTRRRRPDRRGLFHLASGQAGYFTTAQAAEYGTSPALLSALVTSGTMIRSHRGVYRIRDFPFTTGEEIVDAWLAVGRDSAVVSHESALDLWNLTDLIPDAIHLTVSRERRNLPRLPGVHIHTTTRPLAHDDIWPVEAVRVTSPQRTLLDIASAGASPEHVIIGIRQALVRDWIDVPRLRVEARQRGRRIDSMVSRALSEHEAAREVSVG